MKPHLVQCSKKDVECVQSGETQVLSVNLQGNNEFCQFTAHSYKIINVLRRNHYGAFSEVP